MIVTDPHIILILHRWSILFHTLHDISFYRAASNASAD